MAIDFLSAAEPVVPAAAAGVSRTSGFAPNELRVRHRTDHLSAVRAIRGLTAPVEPFVIVTEGVGGQS